MNDSSKRTLSDSDVTRIQDALRSLHAIVKELPEGKDKSITVLPSFDSCDDDQLASIAKRAAYALTTHNKGALRGVLIAAKQGIDSAIREARSAALASFAALDNLPEATRLALKLAGHKVEKPTFTSIPLKELVDCFPEGTDEAGMRVLLKKMNYKLVKGRQSDEKGGPRLHVSLVEGVQPNASDVE